MSRGSAPGALGAQPSDESVRLRQMSASAREVNITSLAALKVQRLLAARGLRARPEPLAAPPVAERLPLRLREGPEAHLPRSEVAEGAEGVGGGERSGGARSSLAASMSAASMSAASMSAASMSAASMSATSSGDPLMSRGSAPPSARGALGAQPSGESVRLMQISAYDK